MSIPDEFGDEFAPPDNSSATVDAQGRVRTDPTKRPLNEQDVAKIVEREANVVQTRTIVDHKGRL